MFGKRHKLKYEAVDDEDDKQIHNSTRRSSAVVLNPGCLWSSLFTSILIGTYYIPSIGLTFYQRWLFQSFRFPLTTVLVHMIVKFLLSIAIRVILARKQGKERVLLGWKEYVLAVAPMGIFSGLDIGLSNWGLELVQVSLYTMTKSTTIIFILAFAILFKLEKKSWSLVFIVVMITIGLVLFTYKSTTFDFLGFLLLVLASMSSGVRWTCVQLLLQKSKMGMRNPIDMIYHMQPWMIVSVLPFAIWMEGSTIITNCQLFRFHESTTFISIAFKVLLGAFIAFFMEVCEVSVVSYTSSLTLSVAGIVKEVFILILAIEWSGDGDTMSAINVIGLLICLSGITSHVIHKIKTSSSKVMERSYEYEVENHELGEHLMDSLHYDNSSESDEKSDTQVLFDILNSRDR